MTTPLDRLATVAKEKVDKYGLSATLTVNVVGAYNVATDAPAASTPTAYSVKATPPELRSTYAPGAAVIQQGLETFVAAEGLAVVPVQGDKLTVAGIVFTVIEVTWVFPGDGVALYGLRVAR